MRNKIPSAELETIKIRCYNTHCSLCRMNIPKYPIRIWNISNWYGGILIDRRRGGGLDYTKRVYKDALKLKPV
jgi:hypothetical protein